MKRFKKILLVSREGTGERTTLARAVELAKRNRARLTLVEVVEEIPRELRMLVTAIPPIDLEKLVVKERKERLEALVAPLVDDGVRAAAAVLVGTPFLEIIREVMRKKHDLVILTAEGRGGVKERLFGSTSLHLLRKCPCPVWVMKPTRSRRYNRILAAVDPHPSDPERTALNVKILDLATSLARLEKSLLHVVHVWRFPGETMHRSGRTRIPKRELEAMLAEARDHTQKNLDELVAGCRLEDLKHRVHLLKGEPRVLIPELVQEERINLIVMGTVCRTGIPGFLIGNTAESVLQLVDTSVLTVKPEAFVTPVTV
ncbi:MAG: universal stress protein [Deltaproteobacteria bacterium]|nr:universal stress protein [Deltaproteobacteria bacterium]MBW2400826.1 universal stress protein [Deltaproteobacteria bacterium]